jgi:hypothetical protein
LAWFSAAPIVSAAAWFGYFIIIYGTANPAAPYGTYGDDTQTSVANLMRGFPGLLFDQQFGLIPNAPVYGFILAGQIVALVRRRRWSAELTIAMVPYMIGVGAFHIWWGAPAHRRACSRPWRSCSGSPPHGSGTTLDGPPARQSGSWRSSSAWS